MWGKSVRIARLAGFDIKVDASWFLIASLVVWSLVTNIFPARVPEVRPEGLLAMALFGLAGLFCSIMLHEFAHAIIARGQGVRPVGIRLFLFGGVVECENGLPAPLTEIWIAMAGPAVSLGLALVFWFSARLIDYGDSFDPAVAVISYLSVFNLILGLGNLIPAYPLDGGRILRAVLWLRSGNFVRATQRATRLSIVLSFCLIALGLFSVFLGNITGGLWPVVVGLFLLPAARADCRTVQTAAALEGCSVGDLMSRNLCTTRPDQTLSELVSQVFLEKGVSFAPVVENGAVLGYVDTHIVKRIDRENWTTTVVDDVIESIGEENTVPPDLPGRDLLDRIARTGRRKFLVVMGNTLVGVITLTDFVSYLNVANTLQQSET